MLNERPTPDTEELKCLALIEVMAVPFERREIALGTLRAIKERDEAREQIDNIRKMLSESGQAVGNGAYDYAIIDMIENLIKSKDFFVRKSDSLEQGLNEAREALMKIEEIFVDGENTHDDRFKMGSIAREYFKK